MEHGRGTGADDGGFVRRPRRGAYGLRRLKGLSPLRIPASLTRVLLVRGGWMGGSIYPVKSLLQRALAAVEARTALIYGRTGVLHAGGRVDRDRRKDSRSQTPARSTDLCRSGGIIEARAHDRRFYLPQHSLYFLPLPQGQGSLRPTLASDLAGFLAEEAESEWLVTILRSSS